MVRLAVAACVGLVVFYVYSLVDGTLATATRVRNLPKPVWILILVCVPLLGSILWFLFGRPRREPRVATRTLLAPDDDPDFLRTLQHNQNGSGATGTHDGPQPPRPNDTHRKHSDPEHSDD